MKNFIQFMILALTAGSVFTVNLPSLVFLAPILGLAAQPFWLYESWKNNQWGIFLCSLVIAGSWIMGYFV